MHAEWRFNGQSDGRCASVDIVRFSTRIPNQRESIGLFWKNENSLKTFTWMLKKWEYQHVQSQFLLWLWYPLECSTQVHGVPQSQQVPDVGMSKRLWLAGTPMMVLLVRPSSRPSSRPSVDGPAKSCTTKKMVETPWIVGKTIYQLVQDLFYPQYFLLQPLSNLHRCSRRSLWPTYNHHRQNSEHLSTF